MSYCKKLKRFNIEWIAAIVRFILNWFAMVFGGIGLVIFLIFTYLSFCFFAVAGHLEEDLIEEDPDKDLLEE